MTTLHNESPPAPSDVTETEAPSPPITRQRVLEAAALIGCDPRLAQRILEHGPATARNRVHRDRAIEVLPRLGFSTRGR